MTRLIMLAVLQFNCQQDSLLSEFWFTAYRINTESAANESADADIQRQSLLNAKACLKTSKRYDHKLKLDTKRLRRLEN